jgi:HK97 gp10 family phage protein
MANNVNGLNLTIINNAEMLDYFNSLKNKMQNRIVLNGMKKAAAIILTEARSNWKTNQKGKSKTGYRDYSSYFKTSPIKQSKNGFGLKVGVQGYNAYKMRWLNWGTGDRYYMSKNNVKHNTGKVDGSNFFYDAVSARKDEAQQMISKAITESLQKTIAKHAKN